MSNLETAFTEIERSASEALTAVTKLARNIKAVESAAKAGDVRMLERALGDANKALQESSAHLGRLDERTQVPFSDLLRGGALLTETLAALRARGVRAHEQDGVIFAFPVLVRIHPEERAISVDKAKVRRIRPTAIATDIERRQRQAPRVDEGRFLQTLLKAYDVLTGGEFGRQVRLSKVYELLTIYPRRGEEQYTRLEFTRDLYRLSQRDQLVTSDGRLQCQLSASTGTRQGPLSIVDEDGRIHDYFAITFFEMQP